MRGEDRGPQPQPDPDWGPESMTPPLSDRLKDVQRQYAEMEHNTATLQNAQQAAWVAENNYRSLTDKCREEFRVRQGRDRKAASRGRPRPRLAPARDRAPAVAPAGGWPPARDPPRPHRPGGSGPDRGLRPDVGRL